MISNLQWRQTHFARGVLLIGILALGLNLLVRLAEGPVWPTFHDEFSYLLAADTFAHGRLTNPPHPLWQFFEDIHILVQPTYQSKYPPGQGLFLALGQVLFHSPMAGIWISGSLAAMAVAWMLRSWLPPRWALLGGLLTALHHVPMRWWNHHYWGGAVAVLGGALMLGGMHRALRHARLRDGAVMGLGLLILAITRPFEGLVLAIASALVLTLRTRKAPWSRLLLRSGLGTLLTLAPGLASLAWYNHRVTGHALLLPYVLHEQQYGIAPLFVFQQPRPMPRYRHEVLRLYHTGYSMHAYNQQHPWWRWVGMTFWKFGGIAWQYTAYGLLAIPLLLLAWAVRRRRVRFPSAISTALLILFLFALCISPATWIMIHYVAPAMPLWILIVVAATRALWRLSPRLRQVLIATGAATLLLLVIDAGLLIWFNRGDGWANQRAALVERLEHEPGKHLVLCPFGKGSIYDLQWVYNPADIDASKVIWARDMGPSANHRLLDYYPHRHLWRLIEWPAPRLIPLDPLQERQLED